MPSANATYLKFACDMADQTGVILRQYFRHPLKINDKQDDSPVTKADRNAEKLMRELIGKHFPTHGILGEEFSSTNPDASYQWVIDPIDGTRSFITGRPLFGTLIALFKDAHPLLGIIDQPVLGERWVGMQNTETHFTSPLGGSIGARPTTLAQAEMSCTSPEMLSLAPTAKWKDLISKAKRMSWGGDCYGYGLLALGQIDLIMECDMKPWDWAALVPIIEGAGGTITQWNGKPLRKEGDGTVLAASCKELHAEAVRVLTR